MTKLQVEQRALNIADRVKRKDPIEDATVEVKSQWIEPLKAARRLAGHANSARGEHILWLIGIEEGKGVVGVQAENLATWWPQVKAQFDDVAPDLVMDLVVTLDGNVFVALLFETDRFPYVIKNPAGGQIQFEVPWREGTMIRSARRTDLVRLVAPLEQMPDFEVLKGLLRANMVAQDTLGWYLELPLFVVAKSEAPVIIPFHRCQAEVEVLGVLNRNPLEKVFLEPVPRPQHGVVPSQTVKASTTEIIIERAGMTKLMGYGKSGMPCTQAEIKGRAPTAIVSLSLLSAHAETPVILNEAFPNMTQEEGQWGLWKN